MKKVRVRTSFAATIASMAALTYQPSAADLNTLQWESEASGDDWMVEWEVWTQAGSDAYDHCSLISARRVLTVPPMYGGQKIWAPVVNVSPSGVVSTGFAIGLAEVVPITGFYVTVGLSNEAAYWGSGLYSFDGDYAAAAFN